MYVLFIFIWLLKRFILQDLVDDFLYWNNKSEHGRNSNGCIY